MPKNPNKYRGALSNIVYRSSWELRFFEWADMNPSVVSWSSEEVVIPYRCETDGLVHRYFVDAHVTVKGADGKLATFLVEIKPFAQTQPPKFPGKNTRRYLTEMETFIKNQSKWKAADKFAKERNVKFMVLTEKDLFDHRK